MEAPLEDCEATSGESKGVSESLESLKLCLACGSTVTNVKLENPDSEYLLLADNEIFSSFCELLNVKLSGKFVWWNFNPESTSSRIFCEDCKRELSLLQDLKRRLVELERDLEKGIGTFKEKCFKAESKFKENDFYAKDKRYSQIRKQITKRVKSSKVEADETEFSSRRKSSLRKRPPPSIEEDPPLSKHPNPIVQLSETDKAIADNYQFPSEKVKDEPVSAEECELDTFFDELPEITSPNPKRSNANKTVPTKRKKRIRGTPKSASTPSKKSAKAKRNVSARKGTETKSSKRKRKIIVYSNDDSEDASLDSDEKEKSLRKTRKRKKDDDTDFEPDEDALEEDEDIDNKDLSNVKSERVRFNAETGRYYFLDVAYEKLDNGKYRCLECKDKEMIIFKYTIRKHSLRAHTSVFSCKECGHCEGSPGDLKKHIRDYHEGEGKRFTDCPICGKPCSSYKGRLERHMATHYSKEEKEEALARGEKILTWADVHSKKDYQCDNCGKAFESKWYLKQHIVAKHPTPGSKDERSTEKELCPKCGKLFLKYYIKTHQIRCQDGKGLESNRKFVCTVCDKRFYRYVELSRHKMNVHDKNYPEKCTVCPKGFASKRQLRIHMNRHQNIRPFKCPDPNCNSAFFTKGNLTRHIDIYHLEGSQAKRKPYCKKGDGLLVNNGKVENKVPNNAIDNLPKLQDDLLLKNSHFMLTMSSANGSQAQDIADVLFTDFPNPPTTQ